MNLQASNQAPTISSSLYPASTYLSKVKLIATCVLFVLAIQIVAAQNSYAGCTESATKAAITASIATLGLVALDCFFLGCLVTATTVGTGGAALGAAALKVVGGAAAYGCVDASLWDKPSRPSSQSSR